MMNKNKIFYNYFILLYLLFSLYSKNIGSGWKMESKKRLLNENYNIHEIFHVVHYC